MTADLAARPAGAAARPARPAPETADVDLVLSGARAEALAAADRADRRRWPLVVLAVLALAVALVVLGSGMAHAAPVPPTPPPARCPSRSTA